MCAGESVEGLPRSLREATSSHNGVWGREERRGGGGFVLGVAKPVGWERGGEEEKKYLLKLRKRFFYKPTAKIAYLSRLSH